MTESRKAFEKHMIEQGHSNDFFAQNPIGDYIWPKIQVPWEAWQAALIWKMTRIEPVRIFSIWIDGHTESSRTLTARDAKEAALRFCEKEMEGVDLENDIGKRTAAFACHGAPFKVRVHGLNGIQDFSCANLLTVKTEVKKWEDEDDDNN